MRKVAIIQGRDICYYDDYHESVNHKIADMITDWEEVTEEDYRDLIMASGKYNFSVIEQPTEQSSFIKKTVADYRKFVAEHKAREEKEKKEREKKALERKLKKEAKTREDKLKLLGQLKEELGVQ